MAHSGTKTAVPPKARGLPSGTENIWHEFWKLRQPRPLVPGIGARVVLTQPKAGNRQFTVETGSGHRFQVDDAEGASGPKPIELVAAALAGCSAFDVLAILRLNKNQQVTGYEVRVEADQAERPPRAFVAVRIHHIVTGCGLDPAAVSEAIRISEENNGAVRAMLRHSAAITTTFELVEDASQHGDS